MKKILLTASSLSLLTLLLFSCESGNDSVDESVASAATISGGPFAYDVGTGEENYVDVNIDDAGTGANSSFLVTDENNNIIAIAGDEDELESEVNFDVLGDGIAYIWHLNYEDGIFGNEVGNNLSVLAGDFKLSNKIEVDKSGPIGAEITGGSYRFCVDTGEVNTVSDIGISDVGYGEEQTFLITDTSLNVLYNVATVAEFPDFNDTSVEDVVRELVGNIQDSDDENAVNEGTSRDWLIWHVNYIGELTYENPDLPNADELINGNAALSNSITVRRDLPNAGTITTEDGTDEFTFTKDDTSDFVTGISFTEDTILEGPSRSYIVTDDAGDIVALPMTIEDLEAIDFDAYESGVYLIWHASFVGTYTTIGADIGVNAADLIECFNISNSITVNVN